MDFNEFKEQFTEDVKQGLADAGIEASWRNRMKLFMRGSNSLAVWRKNLQIRKVFSKENSVRSCRNR